MVAYLMSGDQGWRIRYDCRLDGIPQHTLAELAVKLRLIADELAIVKPGSAVWPMLRESALRLEAGGWRFAYSVPRRGLLAVRGAHPIPAAGAQAP